MSVLVCAECAEPLPPAKPTGPPASYCSARCRGRASYKRRKESIAATRRDLHATVRAETSRVCPECSDSFRPAKTMAQRFCSELCQRRWHRTNNRRTCSLVDCDRPHRARGLCLKHYNETHGADRPRKGRPETRRRNLRIKTQRRRALTKDPTAEKIDRDVVGDRDGWKCGICRKPVNAALAWPDSKSPSLDHIVPLSKGGEHTYANSRITHLSCNVQRSNRGGGEQLALIG